MRLELTIIAVALLGSAIAWRHAPEGAEQAASSPIEPQSSRSVAGVTYASLLDDLDARIAGLQARADQRPGDWLTRMHLGSALLDRAGLTNRIEDFERVQTVLDEAFAIAPDGRVTPLLVN